MLNIIITELPWHITSSKPLITVSDQSDTAKGMMYSNEYWACSHAELVINQCFVIALSSASRHRGYTFWHQGLTPKALMSPQCKAGGARHTTVPNVTHLFLNLKRCFLFVCFFPKLYWTSPIFSPNLKTMCDRADVGPRLCRESLKGACKSKRQYVTSCTRLPLFPSFFSVSFHL